MAGRSKALEPIPPGEVLQEDFLKPLGLSINGLARELFVPPGRISAIVGGKRGITADTSLRLSRYFGNTPHFWQNLQSEYDLRKALRTSGPEIEQRIRPRAGSGAQPERPPRAIRMPMPPTAKARASPA